MMVLLRSFAGQGIVIRIANAPNGLLYSGLGQALGVADGEILGPSIPMVDQGVSRVHHAVVQGLLERVKRQIGACSRSVRSEFDTRQPTMRRA